MPGVGGGGVLVLPYISYIGMLRPIGRVFGPFWSENGYGFGGNYGTVYERIYRFNSKGSKKEREICEFETGALKNFFVFAII